MTRAAWPIRPLGECGRWLSGGTPSRKKAEYWGGDIPWISAKSMGSFELGDAEESVTRLGAENGTRLVGPGAVLFVVRGMSLAKEFRVGLTTRPATFNQDLKAIEPANDVDSRYLAHCLRASGRRILLDVDSAAHGTRKLRTEFIEGFPVPLPPLVEQKRIAGILDAADALRAKRRESIALLDTLLQSTFLDMFGDPVINPMGWEEPSLGQLAQSGFRNGLSPSTKGLVDGEVLTLAAITHGRFDFSARKRARFNKEPSPSQMLSTDRFLICRGNGNIQLVGAGAFPDRSSDRVCFPDTMIAITADPQVLTAAYLESVWGSRRVRRQIEGRARTTNGTHKVNQQILSSIVFPVPPAELQHRFAVIVKSVEKQKAAQRAHLAELDTLFASLQQRAFRGAL